MPIYAYKCASCGFAKDVLQKMSDPPLTVCPSCGAPQFAKQVTAAGFQLKGSGWYVTDFRQGGNSGGGKDQSGAKPADSAAASSSDSAVPAASPAPAPAPAPASSPAASGGGTGSSKD